MIEERLMQMAIALIPLALLIIVIYLQDRK